MADPANPAGMPAEQAQTRDRRRMLRKLGLIAAIAVAIVGLIAVLLLIAPRHVARWVADHYLQDMQIDVEGVKTIDISLFEGEVSMGPVRFHSGTAEPGRIGLLGLKLSLGNLIERQALLQSVVVRDIEVTIRQTADGDILINGVPLRQILAKETAEQQQQQAAPAPEQKQEKQKQGGWGAGVDDMRVRNVQVTFINAKGGTARLRLDHLDLRGFRSWEADQPGTFVITGDLNGIEVNAYGTARPFAEKITAQTEVSIDGIELSRIEEYTGPLGFAQAGGGLSIYSRGEVALYPDGRIEGDANTTMVLGNVDLEDSARGTVKLDQGSIDSNFVYAMSETGVLTVTGAADAKLNQASGQPQQGPGFSLAGADVVVSGLQLTRHPDNALSVAATLQLQAEKPSLAGPTALNADTLGVTLAPLSVDLNSQGTLNVKTSATTRIGNSRLSMPGADAAAGMDLTLAELVARANDLALSQTGDKVQLGTGVAIDASTVALSLPPLEGAAEPQRASIDALSVQLPKVTVDLASGNVALATGGEATLQRLAAVVPGGGERPGVRFGADAATARLKDVQAQAASDGPVRVDATVDATLQRLDGGWGSGAQPQAPLPAANLRGRDRKARSAAPEAAATPETAGRLTAESLNLTLTPLGLRSGKDGLQLSAEGATTLAGLDASIPAGDGQAPFSVQLGTLRLGVSDLVVKNRDGESNVAGGIETSLAALTATQPAPGASGSGRGTDTALKVGSARLVLSPLQARAAGDRTTLQTEGSVDVQKVSVELPRSTGKPAVSASMAQLQSRVDRVQVDQTPRELAWQVGLDTQARGLAAETEGGSAATFKLQTLTVGGLSADQRRKLAIERVVLDRPEAMLTRAYLQGPAAAKESRPREAAQAAEKASQEGWRFRLDSLGLTGNGAIRLRDTDVNPNTNFNVDIQALQVSNLDTGDPSKQTQLRVEGTINQFTELKLSGWAAPFGKQPDFDINARLHRLELPPLSPYAAQAVGVNVESGRLSVDASAAANAGNLKGEVDLTLRDLAFSTLSAEEAKQLSASVGVPIETIVGLLQDDEGRIRLSLPLAGDLASPSFGLGDAIRQALTGAVQAAVMAPFQLAFAPVALIAKAAGSGSGGLAINPVPFDAGSSKLTRTGADMLDGLARVLQEREKLKITVCGRATAQDLQAALAEAGAPESGPGRAAAIEQLAPQLWSIAGERTANVREALSARGAQTSQVGECRILYNPQDNGPPRVEVGL